MIRNGWAALGIGFSAATALFAAAPLVWASGLPAQANCCVATMDLVSVFNEYQRQKDLDEELMQKKSALDREAAARKSKIDSQQAKVDAMDPTDPTFGQARRDLRQLQIDAKNWVDISRAELEDEIADWTARVYDEILNATDAIAKQRGIEVVLYRDEFQKMRDPQQIREHIRNRKVIWASSAADLSAVVLEKLNAEYRAKPRARMLAP